MRRSCTLLLLLTTLACGDSGSTDLAGTLNGVKLQTHHAIAAYSYTEATGVLSRQPDILLSSRDDACTLLQRGQFVENTDVVEITLFASNTADGVPTSPGRFPAVQIPNPPSNPAVFSVVTAGVTGATTSCLDTVSNNAMQGAVNISQLGSSVKPTLGSFDVTFLGGELSGYFYALPCIIRPSSVGGAVACHP